MPGANVFAYDGTGYKPTNRSLTAAIASRTASGYTAVSYAYKLSKVPVAISNAAPGSGATNYVTSTPHGFVGGEIIAITGITPSSYNVTAAIVVVNTTQFYVGKDPAYPYYDADGDNPLNTGLEDFGYNVGIECVCHYVPSDRLNLINSRM